MKRVLRYLAAYILLAAATGTRAQSSPADAVPEPFEGIVYEIEYLGAETQVLLRPCEPSRNCIGLATNTRIRTSSALLQRLFETSLLAQRRVHGTCAASRPGIAQTVVLESIATAGPTDRIRSISCHALAELCTASFFGQEQDVSVQDARAVGVLSVAIVNGAEVQHVTVDNAGLLERVTVNDR